MSPSPMQRLLARAVPLFLLVVAAACGGGDDLDLIGTTAPVSRVEVQPRADTIFLRDTPLPTDVVPLQAVVVGFNGGVLPNARVRWSTDNPDIVSVDSLGVVRPIQAGTATVEASAGGKEGRATIVVISSVVGTQVAVTPALTEANVGDTVRFAAAVVDPNGVPVGGGATFTWTSSNPAVATIDPATGLATFIGAGTVRFTATSPTAGSASTADITVIVREYVGASSGYDHTCSILTTGEVYCWGRGNEGQIGTAALDTVCYDQEADPRRKECTLAPKRAETTVRFNRIAAGGLFSCGVATTGRAYCWGIDSVGQLGGGQLTQTAVPSLVTSIVNFADVSAGGLHACGITTVNTAFCWGLDVFGQLGNAGLLFNSSTPIAVDGELRFQQVSTGFVHTCGALTDGRVVCWGDNRSGQVGVPGFTQLVPVGLDTVPVYDSPREVPLPAGFTARQAVASWGFHSCAVGTNGAAYCWGSNQSGELGIGSTSAGTITPVAVGGGLAFQQLAAGDGFTCGLSGGAVYCWGRNDFGQTGNDLSPPVLPGDRVLSPTPVATPVVFDPTTGLSTTVPVTFTAITAGRRHACGRADDGTLYCWGSDVMGALGSQQQQLVQPRPVRVSRPI